METPFDIEVIRPGLYTTVQDLGRTGYQANGIPVGGAMDRLAFQTANYLVDNPKNSAGLEVTLKGPTLLFFKKITFAITGAKMQPVLNDQPIVNNSTLEARPGDILKFGRLQRGCRCYIAFAGGLNVPLVLGSQCTCPIAGIGGIDGRPLKAGDCLSINKTQENIPLRRVADIDHQNNDTIHIITGPETSRLTKASVIALLRQPFAIDANSNRMAIRLTGPKVLCRDDDYDIVSSGTTMGQMQLSGDGCPIILMADRPTIGGYPRVGYIASFDLPKLAQYPPKKEFYFKEITHLDSQSQYNEWMATHKLPISLY